MIVPTRMGCVLTVLLCITHYSHAVDYSTPPGITLAEITYNDPTAEAGAKYLWTRLGDAEGWTLFVLDDKEAADKPYCTGDCAAEFPPVIAPPGAVPMAHWSVVKRDDGTNQWAYKNKPLHRFARQQWINQIADQVIAAQFEDPNNPLLDNKRLTKRSIELPKGWQIAKFEVTAKTKTPSAVWVREIPAAGLVGFVDKRGMTIYSFKGDPENIDSSCAPSCQTTWTPLMAAALSKPIGEFTFVQRDDGSRQWAWQGAPLYTYSGDLEPGDINGVLDKARENKPADRVDSSWRIPAVVRHFIPDDVLVREDLVYDKILSTAEGMPLYTRYPYEIKYFPRNKFSYSYDRGKKLGAKGCNADCERVWQPFFASDNAQAGGYWEIVTREDGKRQWAYKGFLQYINIHDKPFGQAAAGNTYDYVVGDDGPYKVKDVLLAKNGRAAGLYWRVTSP